MSLVFSPSPMTTLTLPPIHSCLDDNDMESLHQSPHDEHPHIRKNIYLSPPKNLNTLSTPPLTSMIQPQDEIFKIIQLVEDGNRDGVLALLAYHRSLSSSLLDLSHQHNQRHTHHPSPQPLVWSLLDEALCTSCERGHLDLVLELLNTQSWINLNAHREKDSMTPLFLAAQYNHVEIVKLLIIRGACTDYNRIIKRQKLRRQPVTRFDDTKMSHVQHLELQYMAAVSTELEELGNDHDDDDDDEEDDDVENGDEDEDEDDDKKTSGELDVTLPIAIVDLILDYTRVMGVGGYPD